MEKFRQKIDNVLKLVCRRPYQIDSNYYMSGVRLWFVSGQDAYEFIIRQPEFDWEIVPEISTVNALTGELRKWNVVYTPTGVTID